MESCIHRYVTGSSTTGPILTRAALHSGRVLCSLRRPRSVPSLHVSAWVDGTRGRGCVHMARHDALQFQILSDARRGDQVSENSAPASPTIQYPLWKHNIKYKHMKRMTDMS